MMDIPYGEVPAQVIDLYMPRNPASAVVLYVHGGGWVGGDEDHAPPKRLTRYGFVVASIGYRLAPQHAWPSQAEDLAAALAYLRARRAELKLPDIWATCGISAGGHLALYLGLTATQISACVGIAAPVDLVTCYRDTSRRRPFRQLFGGGAWSAERAAGASPIGRLQAGSPPVLLVYGERDTTVPPTQAVAFVAQAREVGALVETIEQPVGHPANYRSAEPAIADWIARQIARQAASSGRTRRTQ